MATIDFEVDSAGFKRFGKLLVMGLLLKSESPYTARVKSAVDLFWKQYQSKVLLPYWRTRGNRIWARNTVATRKRKGHAMVMHDQYDLLSQTLRLHEHAQEVSMVGPTTVQITIDLFKAGEMHPNSRLSKAALGLAHDRGHVNVRAGTRNPARPLAPIPNVNAAFTAWVDTEFSAKITSIFAGL